MGGKPSKPKIPVQPKIEEVQKVEEDASSQAEQERRRVAVMSGRQSTMLAGIANALKQKLG